MPNLQLAASGNEPAYNVGAITTSDSVDQAAAMRYIYVGGAGDVSVIMPNGTTAVFKSVPVGTLLPVRAIRVKATGTTATNLVALW